MARIVDGNLILDSNEVIKFPITQISDTGSLEISTGIDVTQLKGVRVDMTTLVDEGILTYDSTSGMLIFLVSTPPTPPSGPTRGVWGGGYDTDGHTYSVMDYVTIASPSNATSFGNLSQSRANLRSTSNSTNDRGVWTGGSIEVAGPDWIAVDTIDYHSIANDGGACTDFGNLVYELYGATTTSNATNERGVTGGGQNYTDDPGDIGQILYTSYFTINSPGNATGFGAGLTAVRNNAYGTSNHENERAIFGPGANWPTADYLTISTLSDGAEFGDLYNICFDAYPYPRSNAGSTSNGTNERGVFAGGFNYCLTIDYITINSTGNATYFGDLTITIDGTYDAYGRGYLDALSSGTAERGVFGGGLFFTTPYVLDIIDYITINSTGNATDFGDLTVAREELAACSG